MIASGIYGVLSSMSKKGAFSEKPGRRQVSISKLDDYEICLLLIKLYSFNIFFRSSSDSVPDHIAYLALKHLFLLSCVMDPPVGRH